MSMWHIRPDQLRALQAKATAKGVTVDQLASAMFHMPITVCEYVGREPTEAELHEDVWGALVE